MYSIVFNQSEDSEKTFLKYLSHIVKLCLDLVVILDPGSKQTL
jgi:hypothetical protein